MSENVADALVATVRRVSQEVVRNELREFSEKLQKVTLEAVETAFQHYLRSAKFREAVREAAVEEGGGGGVSQEAVKEIVKQELRESSDIQAALTKYFAEHGADILRNESLQIELNSLVLTKAKELFKRSALSGSLDIKKAVTRVVESVLEARGITGGGKGQTQDISEAVSQYLKENLGNMLTETISSEVKSFLASEEMKELLDSKFRAIDLYLKTDLIPKVVKREITKAFQGA